MKDGGKRLQTLSGPGKVVAASRLSCRMASLVVILLLSMLLLHRSLRGAGVNSVVLDRVLGLNTDTTFVAQHCACKCMHA